MKISLEKYILFSVFCMLVMGMGVAAASPVPLRGVVEGFYGTPWTHQQRLDMVRFIGSEGMNSYIYAPKDDVYHRDHWRDEYPLKQRMELWELNETAKKAGVQVIFALSPGLDLHFQGNEGENDRNTMLKKLVQMYNLGFRQFAIFFDDIPEKNAVGQADFINYIDDNFIKSHSDCSELIVVPTEYFLLDMEREGMVKEYTAELSSRMNPDVMVLYTGLEVCPDGLTEEHVAKGSELYSRQHTGIWWNYPVNDYMPEKPAMGPLDKMPKYFGADAFFVNPMDRAELSKLSIATAAEFIANPAEYDEEMAFKKAVEKLYGIYDCTDENGELISVSGAMERFARANQRLENSWAHIGRQDEGEVSEADMEILKKYLPANIAEDIFK